ncbi:hypothetical protein [Streptomyces sp. MAR4 CNX-425]|uniref:hypothetical protein n=1 Tax=Streptomyces sp. MAR4 CNX-425 TaxID=3406343 RepID=UPI003B5122AE
MVGGLLAFVSTMMPWAGGLSLWDLDTLQRLFSDPDTGPLYGVNAAATSLVLCGVLCMFCGVGGLVARDAEVMRRWGRVSAFAAAGLLIACIGTLIVVREALDDDLGAGVIAMFVATLLGLYGSLAFDRGATRR